MGKNVIIGGRIHNPEVGNVAVGANEVLDDTKVKKQNVINAETDAELLRLENEKQDNLSFDDTPTENSTNPITSGGVYASELLIHQAIEMILALIPSAASALNQLADKSFVNSTVATATATFRGTYNVVTDLGLEFDATHEQIAAALLSHIATADNNDYAFVQIPVSATSTDIRVTERYKFNGTAWAYEYDLNNSGFTALQWAAINSGITALLVEKLGALPTAAELALALAGKQATLTFDNAPVAGSNNPVKSGGLYELFAAIDAKMPAGASANNKLVAENRLAAYVAAIIGALDATFDLTSADGHVTFRMTQTNGVIASVQILTSDIASASALTTLTGRVSTNETDIANLQAAYAGLTQSDVIIVNGALPSSGQQQNKIYRQPDQDHTPPQFYSDFMWNGLVWVLMATYNNAIDAVPTAGSHNLVESGGVKFSIETVVSKAAGETISNGLQMFKTVDDNGNVVYNENYFISPKFRVDFGDVAYIYSTNYDGKFIVYDQNDEYLDYWGTIAGRRPITVNVANTYYCRAVFLVSDINNVYLDVPNQGVAFYPANTEYARKKIIEAGNKISVNALTLSKYSLSTPYECGVKLNTSGGTVYSKDDCVTDYIAIPAGTNMIFFETPENDTARICIYRSNKSVKVSFEGTTNISNNDPEYAYVRATFKIGVSGYSLMFRTDSQDIIIYGGSQDYIIHDELVKLESWHNGSTIDANSIRLKKSAGEWPAASQAVRIPANTKFWVRTSTLVPKNLNSFVIDFYDSNDEQIKRVILSYVMCCTPIISLDRDAVRMQINAASAFTEDYDGIISIEPVSLYYSKYDNKLALPNYYFANNYINNKVSRIDSLIKQCAGNGDAFIFVTDEHWEHNAKRSLALMNYIQESTCIDKIFDGGDTGHNLPAIEMTRLRSKMWKGKVYYTTGNHEYLSVSTQPGLYPDGSLDNFAHYAFSMHNDNQKSANAERNYYYVDNDRQKIRYIILNVFEQGPETHQGDYYYTTAVNAIDEQQQLDWLENDALNVASDWNVIVFSHMFYVCESWEGTTVSTNGVVVPVAMAQILLRHNTTNKGKVIGIICGHVHRDATHYLTGDMVGLIGIEGRIPMIVTTCDAQNFEDIPSEDLQGRELATIHEQAFDVVVVNRITKTIHAVRIGGLAGEDFQWGSLEERSISYD